MHIEIIWRFFLNADDSVGDGACESAFLISSQVMAVMLICEEHVEFYSWDAKMCTNLASVLK